MLKYILSFIHIIVYVYNFNQSTMISQQPGCHGPWCCVSACICYIQDAVGNPLLSGGSLLPCLAQPDKMCQV